MGEMEDVEAIIRNEIVDVLKKHRPKPEVALFVLRLIEHEIEEEVLNIKIRRKV